MREHQIVITLKPEQFLEVQRLARVAGAKSMGMFVRQQLLAALGIEGSSTKARAAAGADTRRIAGALRRLHGELKVFVAESLANTYIGQPETAAETAAEPPGGQAADQAPSVGEGLPAVGEDTFGFGLLGEPGLPGEPEQSPVEEALVRFDHARDELESIAQRAFAISPRLGSMEEVKEGAGGAAASPPSNDRDPLDELLEDPLTQRLDTYASQAAAKPVANAAGSGEHEEEGEEEDEVFDVPLPASDRPARPAQTLRRNEPPPPPSGPPPGGLSGGPPPRKRQ